MENTRSNVGDFDVDVVDLISFCPFRRLSFCRCIDAAAPPQRAFWWSLLKPTTHATLLLVVVVILNVFFFFFFSSSSSSSSSSSKVVAECHKVVYSVVCSKNDILFILLCTRMYDLSLSPSILHFAQMTKEEETSQTKRRRAPFDFCRL